MMILYTIGVRLYVASIYIASVFNEKANLWVSGRRGWRKGLGGHFKKDDRVFWFHCASLGEFEQGRPVIESIKEKDPTIRVVVTFFSPSGYEVRKNYDIADIVMYLPSDTPGNVKFFIDAVRPEKAIFIKYEFWFNYLSRLQKLKIPVFLVSGIFRSGHHFFKWYGTEFRNILKGFSHLFVQDIESERLLGDHGIENVSVSGDTRFDRVYDISRKSRKIEVLERFGGSERMIVAGSTWPAEEEILCKFINDSEKPDRWVIAPHEIGENHLQEIEKRLAVEYIRYSNVTELDISKYRVLIIDNIGILSSVYRYGDLAVIGGGFGKGIHNVLEPASWGLPVLFGPNYTKFKEAIGLLTNGGGFSFNNYDQFCNTIESLLNDKALLDESSMAASDYVIKNLGATKIVIDYLL